MSYEVGGRIETERNGKGRIAFMGKTQFAEGDWIGVVLDEPKGKNNGNVQGVQYFNCEPNFGLFIKANQLKSDTPSRSKPSGLKAPALRKDSVHGSVSRLSPAASPRMSPAVSTEQITKVPPPKKTPSTLAEKRRSMLESKAQKNATRDASKESSKIPGNVSSPAGSSVSFHLPSSFSSASLQDTKGVPEDDDVTPTDSVKARVLKMEKTPLAMPTAFGDSSMDEGTELEFLRLQVKDLTEKLETLRLKRKEDRIVLLDYERVKVHLQALVEYKAKATETHSQLQRELQEKNKEIDGLREWKEVKSEEWGSAEENLESAMLDKEFAEEKAEQLQTQVEDLQIKCEELEMELATLREEMSTEGVGVPQGNTVHLKQKDQTIEKMKELVIKLRDSNGEAVAEKNAAKAENDRLRVENGELIRMCEMWKKKAEEAEEAIVNLKEQVDALLGSEDLVQILSDKNLDMEEKLRQLEMEKEDLEAMRDMDEQISEEQKEVEKDLRKEIEALHISINEMLLRQRQDEAHAEQLSQTIIKFRKKTAELNSENEDLKDDILNLREELNTGKQEERDMAGQESLALVNASRTFADIVESRVKSVELEYSQLQVKYLKAFLPDNFTRAGGDNDCVNVNVVIPRIADKADILAQLMKEKYPVVPGGMRAEHVKKSHKGEQWAQQGRLTYSCTAIKAVCNQIQTALKRTTGDGLAAVAHLCPDIALQERNVDNYIELIKQGRLDENTSLDQLDTISRYLRRNVLDEHLGGRESFDAVAWLQVALQQFSAAIAWWRVNQSRLNFLLITDSSDMKEWAAKIGEDLNACEVVINKTKNRLSTEINLIITQIFFEDVTRSLFLIERIASVLHETCAFAAVQMSMLADMSGFEGGRVKEMLQSVVEKMHGKTSLDKIFHPVNKEMASLMDHITSMQKAIEEGAMQIDANNHKNFPPLLERAHARKQAAAEAEGLRWQIEKKENEINELKKTIKAKIDDISHMKLRLDMAESRADKVGQADKNTVQSLQARIDQLVNDNKKAKIDFDESLDAMQNQLVTSEKECDELKEKLKNMSKKALLQGMQSMERAPSTSPQSTPARGGGSSSAEVAVMEAQLSNAMAQMRRMHLESRAAKAEWKLDPLLIPEMVSGPFSLSSKKVTDPTLDAITKEAEHLQRESGKYNIFTPVPGSSWASMEEQRNNWLEDKEKFHFRVESCRARLHRYWKEQHPGVEVPTLIGIQPRRRAIPKEEMNMHSKTFKDICSRWIIAST